KVDAVGRTQPGGDRRQFPFWRYFYAPAAPGRFRLMAAAEADVEGDVEIALFVAGRAEGELVVVAGDAPLVADRVIFVRHVVAVHQFRQLGTLHDVDVLAVHV